MKLYLSRLHLETGVRLKKKKEPVKPKTRIIAKLLSQHIYKKRGEKTLMIRHEWGFVEKHNAKLKTIHIKQRFTCMRSLKILLLGASQSFWLISKTKHWILNLHSKLSHT